MLKMIAALTILIVLGVGISSVFGEDYQVQVSENGFEYGSYPLIVVILSPLLMCIM